MRVGAAARKLWLLLGLSCVAAGAYLAYRAFGPAQAALASTILAIAGVPAVTSAVYISVDVPLTLFVVMLLAHLTGASDRTSYRDRVWVPALLCGAAMASKYTGAVVLVPAVVSAWLYAGSSRFSRSIELVLLSLIVFLVLCPRFVLDLPRFLDGLTYESHHYGFKGHKRFTIKPGWNQLKAYFGDGVATFGWVLTVCAGLALVDLGVKAPKRALVLTSFALCWVAMLCRAKVHFSRNLTPVLVVVGVLAAHGLQVLWTSAAMLNRFALTVRRRVAMARGALVAVVVAMLSWSRLLERHQHEVDSRIRVSRWVKTGLQGDAPQLLIPSALPFSTETLPAKVRVQRVDLHDTHSTAAAAQPGSYMLVPQWTQASGGVAARVAALAPGIKALPRHQVLRTFEGKPAVPGIESELSVNPTLQVVRFE